MEMQRELRKYEKAKTLLGLNLAELIRLTKKLRDNEYRYDRDGKIEFEEDIRQAAELAVEAQNEFMNGDL